MLRKLRLKQKTCFLVKKRAFTKCITKIDAKHESTDFNANIASTNDFKSFKYKAKLLGKTVADGANGIFKKCNNCCSIKMFK